MSLLTFGLKEVIWKSRELSLSIRRPSRYQDVPGMYFKMGFLLAPNAHQVLKYLMVSVLLSQKGADSHIEAFAFNAQQSILL